jgi:hypothetical protein
VAATAVACVLAVAGCGGSDDRPEGATRTTTTAAKTLTTAEQADAERARLARVEARKTKRENAALARRLRGPVRRAVGADQFVSLRVARYVVVTTRLQGAPTQAFANRLGRAVEGVVSYAAIDLRGEGGKRLLLVR